MGFTAKRGPRSYRESSVVVSVFISSLLPFLALFALWHVIGLTACNLVDIGLGSETEQAPGASKDPAESPEFDWPQFQAGGKEVKHAD